MMSPLGKCLVKYWSCTASISESSVMGRPITGRATPRNRYDGEEEEDGEGAGDGEEGDDGDSASENVTKL